MDRQRARPESPSLRASDDIMTSRAATLPGQLRQLFRHAWANALIAFGFYVYGSAFVFGFMARWSNALELYWGELYGWRLRENSGTAVGSRLVDLGRRLRRTAIQDERIVSQAQVLYLRAFQADAGEGASRVHTHWARAVRVHDEEIVEAALRSVGVCLALNEPGVALLPSGMPRVEFRRPDWQSNFEALASSSALVVLRASLRMGQGEGLLWELGRCFELVEPERLLLSFHLNLPAARLEPRYEEFKGRTAHLFPKPLPALLDSHRFIGFRHDWTPVPLCKLEGRRRGSTLRTKRSDALKVREGLSDWIQRFESEEPRGTHLELVGEPVPSSEHSAQLRRAFLRSVGLPILGVGCVAVLAAVGTLYGGPLGAPFLALLAYFGYMLGALVAGYVIAPLIFFVFVLEIL